MTIAASAMADIKVWAHRSCRVWIRPPVLELAEHIFDAMTLAVERLGVRERYLAAGLGRMQAAMPRSARAWRNQSAS